MIRLGLDWSPRWVDLGEGVRLKMRFATSIEQAAAEASAQKRIRAAVAGREAFDDIGVDLGITAEQLDDPIWILGLTRYLIACELAAMVIVDWEGVLSDAGEKARLGRGELAELLKLEFVRHGFEREAFRYVELIRVEGGKSEPSPTGSAAVGATTAETVRNSDFPAPTGSQAPTGNSVH